MRPWVLTYPECDGWSLHQGCVIRDDHNERGVVERGGSTPGRRRTTNTESFTTATLGYVNWAGGEVEEWLLVLRAWKKNFELIAFGLVPLSFGLVLFFFTSSELALLQLHDA